MYVPAFFDIMELYYLKSSIVSSSAHRVRRYPSTRKVTPPATFDLANLKFCHSSLQISLELNLELLSLL